MILLADSEGPDQTARMRRLIWAFAVRTCSNSFFLHVGEKTLISCGDAQAFLQILGAWHGSVGFFHHVGVFFYEKQILKHQQINPLLH